MLTGWPGQPFTNINGDGTIKIFSDQIGAAGARNYYRIKAN